MERERERERERPKPPNVAGAPDSRAARSDRRPPRREGREERREKRGLTRVPMPPTPDSRAAPCEVKVLPTPDIHGRMK